MFWNLTVKSQRFPTLGFPLDDPTFLRVVRDCLCCIICSGTSSSPRDSSSYEPRGQDDVTRREAINFSSRKRYGKNGYCESGYIRDYNRNTTSFDEVRGFVSWNRGKRAYNNEITRFEDEGTIIATKR